MQKTLQIIAAMLDVGVLPDEDTPILRQLEADVSRADWRTAARRVNELIGLHADQPVARILHDLHDQLISETSPAPEPSAFPVLGPTGPDSSQGASP